MAPAAPARSGLRGLAVPYLRELGGEPTVVICGATVCMLMSRYHGSADFFREVFGPRFAGHPAAEALPYFWWFGMSQVLYLLVPLALSRLTGGSFTRRYGLGLGEARVGLAIGGLFLAAWAEFRYTSRRFSPRMERILNQP